MSLQTCSGTTGFPIKISQNLFDEWPNGINPADPKVANQLVVPTNINVSWSPSTTIPIRVDTTNSEFKITGLESVANGTTLTYGDSTYSCQPILLLVKIQHADLIPSSPATQELIMTFKIKNASTKKANPSSPDIILLCRPVILASQTNIGSSFWKAVNTAASTADTQVSTTYNAASNFTYDSKTLLPMITYETCIPTRLVGGANVFKEGATRIRVYVVTQPLSIPSTDSGSGKCKLVQKFIIPVNGLPDIFDQSGYTSVQFTNGKSADGKENAYPSFTPSTNNLTITLAGVPEISSWDTGTRSVLQTFEYMVPDNFIGKSLSEIAAMSSAPKSNSTKKPFKCFTIDPSRDIVDDTILIDPTTGEPLEDTRKKMALQASGGDPDLAAALNGEAAKNTGILPGDIEIVLVILISLFGGALLLAQTFYTLRLFMIKEYEDGRIQILFLSGTFLIIFTMLYATTQSAKKTPGTPLPARVV